MVGSAFYLFESGWMMPFTYRCPGQLRYSLWMERRKLQLSLRGIPGRFNDQNIFKKVWHLPKYIYRCPRLFSLKDKLAGKLKQPAQNNCGWLHRQHDISSDGNNTKKTVGISSSTYWKTFHSIIIISPSVQHWHYPDTAGIPFQHGCGQQGRLQQAVHGPQRQDVGQGKGEDNFCHFHSTQNIVALFHKVGRKIQSINNRIAGHDEVCAEEGRQDGGQLSGENTTVKAMDWGMLRSDFGRFL